MKITFMGAGSTVFCKSDEKTIFQVYIFNILFPHNRKSIKYTKVLKFLSSSAHILPV